MSQVRAMLEPFLTPYITITGTGTGRTVRNTASRYGLDRVGTYINSQFFVSILSHEEIGVPHFTMAS